MNVIKFIVSLLFCCPLFGQQNNDAFELSKFEKQYDNINFLKDFFDFKKSDTLLCLNNHKFISIKKDSVTLYKVKSNKVIFKKRIFKNKLDIISLFNLNPLELSIEEKEGKKIVVQDGTEYSIEIFKNDKHLELKSYSPETYVENKYPFYEQRSLFLTLYKKLDELFIDDFFLKIQNANEVFIEFEESENMSKKILKDKNIVDGKEI